MKVADVAGTRFAVPVLPAEYLVVDGHFEVELDVAGKLKRYLPCNFVAWAAEVAVTRLVTEEVILVLSAADLNTVRSL